MATSVYAEMLRREPLGKTIESNAVSLDGQNALSLDGQIVPLIGPLLLIVLVPLVLLLLLRHRATLTLLPLRRVASV